MEEVLLRDYVVCGPFPHGALLGGGSDPLFVEWLRGDEALRDGGEAGGRKCVRVAADERGLLDFTKVFGEDFKPFWRLDHGLAYAYSEVEVEGGTYVLLTGSEDGMVIYVDGIRVFTQPVARRFVEDFYAIPLHLEGGSTRFLFKVSRYAGNWLLRARLVRTDAPFIIHTAKVIKPNLVRGRRERVYLSIPILALRDLNEVVVSCCEGWFGSRTVRGLREGEEVPVALPAEPSSAPQGDEETLTVRVEGDGCSQELKLKLKVVGEDEHRVETYLSQVDGSVHTYGLKPPRGYREEGKYALLVSLHGFKGYPYFSEQYGDKDWLFVAGPAARDGEVPYREVGFLEVLEVMKAVSSKYPIDLDRICLSGHSMGGYGTWAIGVRVPYLFAAILPLSSRGDLSSDAERLRGRPGWEGVAELIEHYNPARFVKNLSATPVFVSHGSADEVVPVGASRSMVERLRGAGLEVVYEEVEGVGHTWEKAKASPRYGLDWVDRESIEAFLAARVREVPRRVVAVVDSDRFSRVWWLIVHPRGGLARVEAEFNGGTVAIKWAENVESIELDLEMLRHLGLGGELRVAYGSSELRVRASYLNRVVLELDGGLRLARRVEEGLRKRAPVTGPLMDALNAPFLVVYPEGEEACRRAAHHIQRWWLNWAGGYTRVVSDVEALAGRLERDYNLVLVGGPSLNAYAREVAGLVKPVKFMGPDEVEVRGTRYKREGVGVAFVYPNPLNSKRYVAVVGGESREAVEAVERLPLTLVPDYLVYDPRLLGRAWEGVLASGLFDERWE